MHVKDLDLTGRRLPSIRGRALDRTTYDLPADLASAATLLIVAFRQRQQADVDTWLPAARRIAEHHTAFGYFEVPLIDIGWRPLRGWIDGGMRAGIPDPEVRATTLTAYQRRGDFLRDLDIPGVDRILVLLVDADGFIRWAGVGPRRSSTTGTDGRCRG